MIAALLLMAQAPTVTVTIDVLKSADQLRTECIAVPSPTDGATVVRRASCIAYVAAVADTTENLRVVFGFPVKFCVARGVTAGELTKVVTNWLRPRTHISGPASYAVMNALSESYPCK